MMRQPNLEEIKNYGFPQPLELGVYKVLNLYQWFSNLGGA